MKPTTKPLSLSHSLWVALIVTVWVLTMIVLMGMFPIETHSKPTSWIFFSSILILLFAIKRFDGGIKETLGLKSIHPLWVLFAIGLGIIYWLLDYWLINQLLNTNPDDSIQTWRLANENYLPITVFIGSVIMAPYFEELFFRGLLFRTLANRMHWLLAACLTATTFALIHWSWPEFISLIIIGLVYALITHKSGSVIPAIIAHIVHNLITFSFYSQYQL